MHLQRITFLYQLISQRRINCRVKYNRYCVYPSFANNLFSYCLILVKYFYVVQKQYMLFWLLKDA